MRHRAAMGFILLAAFTGCADDRVGDRVAIRDEAGNGPASAKSEEARRPPVYVDSILPLEEELRRFREGMEPVTGLSGEAGSPEELVSILIDRLEAADTLGIGLLGMNRVEFAYLYYPHTIYTAPPYRLSPALVWFQIQNPSSRGLNRLLTTYAGESLYYTGLTCPDDGEPFGEGRIWHDCRVQGRIPAGETVEERLFGSILGVGGRYKFVSFANEL